jgi:hypothetical protein
MIDKHTVLEAIQALGLQVPLTLQVAADEVIE